MGLGKTLQCITLMWTLLKQSPEGGKSAIQKCVIVCPLSLVRNWANELVKWLGKDTVTPFGIDGKGTKAELTAQLKQWGISSGRSVTRPVLIVSYETLRLNVGGLADVPIGLLLCDEGHRLKNGESQTFVALNGLRVDRRVILSGTPIQVGSQPPMDIFQPSTSMSSSATYPPSRRSYFQATLSRKIRGVGIGTSRHGTQGRC